MAAKHRDTIGGLRLAVASKENQILLLEGELRNVQAQLKEQQAQRERREAELRDKIEVLHVDREKLTGALSVMARQISQPLSDFGRVVPDTTNQILDRMREPRH